MEKAPTSADARESLNAHVAARGAEIRAKYGPDIGWPQLKRILEDRECVRYPCRLAFDAGPLEPGECAFPEPLGKSPEDGFRLCIHPYFSTEPGRVPRLALYQIVAINYGAFASPEDAESFGAAVLGISRDQYYSELCAMADEIHAGDPVDAGAGGACACAGTPAEDAVKREFVSLANACATKYAHQDMRTKDCTHNPKECRGFEEGLRQDGPK